VFPGCEGHAKGKVVTIAQPHRYQADIGFRKKVREAPDRIEPAQPEQPGTVLRRIQQRRNPQLVRENRFVAVDRIDFRMGHKRNFCLRHGRDGMVERLQGIAVKINEITRNMDRQKLAQTLAIIIVPAQNSIQQQRAVVQGVTSPNERCSRGPHPGLDAMELHQQQIDFGGVGASSLICIEPRLDHF
jgi:hypothetical protein